MRTRKKTKKKTGRLLPALAVALLLMLAAFSALAKEKPKDKKKVAPAAALVAGTVFRDAGFALPGAEVVATPDPPQGKKQWKTTGNARGEFFLRLPAGPASYTVVVRANGFRPQEKKVTIAADERLDFNFLLEPGGENAK